MAIVGERCYAEGSDVVLGLEQVVLGPGLESEVLAKSLVFMLLGLYMRMDDLKHYVFRSVSQSLTTIGYC